MDWWYVLLLIIFVLAVIHQIGAFIKFGMGPGFLIGRVVLTALSYGGGGLGLAFFIYALAWSVPIVSLITS